MNNVQLEHAHHRPSGRTFPLCFLAHDLDVPMNVGSLFRIADALGVERIFLSGQTPVPPNPKVTRTARSTERWVPFEYRADGVALARELKDAGWVLVSLEITSGSRDVRALVLPPGRRVCLILGAENGGVAQALLDLSDHTVHVPMMGRNSSMNVANACSIATFEILRGAIP